MNEAYLNLYWSVQINFIQKYVLHSFAISKPLLVQCKFYNSTILPSITKKVMYKKEAHRKKVSSDKINFIQFNND